MNKDLYKDVYYEFNQKWALISSGTIHDFGCMTIAWASLGVLWRKPIVTVYIKPIRNTHKYLLENNYFTLCFFPDKYKDDLLKLGTISGRDNPKKIDKTVLTAIPLNNHTVGFSQAGAIYICKKIYQQKMDVLEVPAQVRNEYYTEEEIHTMFIGEIEEVLSQ